MRRFTRAIAMTVAPILALTVAGCGSDEENASGTSGKSTYTVMTATDPSRYLIYYAFQHGLVESDSVELKFEFLPFAAAQQASGTRQYDLVEINPTTTVAQNEAGVTSEMLVAGLSDSGTTRIFVAKDSPITSVDQLEGKRVAAVALPTSYMLATRYLMQEKFGLDVPLEGGDVMFSAITAPAQLLSTLKAGGVDAIVGNGPTTYEALQDPDLREIYNVYEELPEYLPGSTVVTNINMYTDPDSIDTEDIPEIQRMFAEAREYYEANKEEVIANVAEENDVPEDLVRWTADYLSLSPSPMDEEQKAWVEGFLQIAVEMGTIEEAPPVDTLFAN